MVSVQRTHTQKKKSYTNKIFLPLLTRKVERYSELDLSAIEIMFESIVRALPTSPLKLKKIDYKDDDEYNRFNLII